MSERTTKSSSLLIRILKVVGISLTAIILTLAIIVGIFSWRTESEISNFKQNVIDVSEGNPAPVYSESDISSLPKPVQEYFEFTFVGSEPAATYVEIDMEGEFRRPLTEAFNPTEVEQTIAVGTPALLFAARSSMTGGIWARAYDHYAEGKMEMRAKIGSTLTVVNEPETPELNQTSLQRWLLESSFYPQALLPGGPVSWEAIDDSHARAVVEYYGSKASLVATFNDDGSLASFEAEADGDLTTPYHGSGEHVVRSDYKEVAGMMVPHSFTVSRAADGELYPFWRGEVTSISFNNA